MRIYQNKLAAAAMVAALSISSAFAGNPQRVGSAGAPELLINPWARSGGWGAVNVATVSGVEATYVNIAGTALTDGTEVGFTNTQWLVGGDISINSAGFVQSVGATGALSASFTVLDYGEWEIRNEDNPEGGIGTISPSSASIGLGYSQRFTESIIGGVRLNLYNQTSDNLNVAALTIDAGVQYVAGKRDQMKFGITLKNVGPSVAFEGDGQSITLTVPQTGFTQAYDQRSAEFELPTALSIGGSYDFDFNEQRLTLAGAFQSNSFESDQYTVGAEYALKNEILMVRSGYTFFNQEDIVTDQNVLGGLSAGMSVKIPLSGDKKKNLLLNYSYRTTDLFDGIHYMGLNFSL